MEGKRSKAAQVIVYRGNYYVVFLNSLYGISDDITKILRQIPKQFCS